MPPGKESQPLTSYKTGQGGAEGTEEVWKQPHNNHQRTSHLNSLFRTEQPLTNNATSTIKKMLEPKRCIYFAAEIPLLTAS